MYKSIFTLLVVLAFSSLTFAQNEMRTNVSTFDVVSLKTNGHYNGSDQKGGFWNGHFYYRNSYDTAWKSWSGIAVSNNTDTVTNSFTNEYSSITGGGINGTKNYAVCYIGGTIKCEKPTKLTGFYVTNTTYTYRDIKAGSAFSKKFGGTTGNDKDWYRIKIMSYSGGVKSDSLRFYLADFQNDDNSKDYILKDWTWVDLESFKISDSLVLTFESSDVGQFGINTPTYVAIDDFNTWSPKNSIVFNRRNFENLDFLKTDSIWDGQKDTSGGFLYNGLYFENNYNTQWNVWSGWALSRQKDTSKSGFEAQCIAINPKGSYAVAYGRASIRLPYHRPEQSWFINFNITNSTYTFKDMKNGSGFSKKFGGATGNDLDFLKLSMIYYDAQNRAIDTTTMMLADYSKSPKQLLNSWSGMNALFFNKVQRIEFQLESSDNGTFGMNTPAYFCLDEMMIGTSSIGKISHQKIKIYPNPSSTFIIADVQNAQIFEIIDMTGRQFMLNDNPQSNKIDISELPKGIYCLKVKANEMVYSARFLKL
ncbi:MAG: DUF4465 domain-containing protein [Bacteroidia bacterium]